MLIIDENSYHKENLEYLFSILESTDEINCVLIGYFSKVVSSFFQKNKREICSYFYSNDSHAHSFTEHLYSKSLMDPLKNFLVIFPEDQYSHHDESNSEARNLHRASPFSKFYQQRVKIFNSLFALLETADEPEVVHNAQYIIETLIAKIDQTVDGSKLLDDVVLRKENIQAVFNCLKNVSANLTLEQ
jgi:archaellum biogenesis ATPase FlaH